MFQTLRRCYSRVKERGVGKRKSSYTFEQLERVFGQGGWDTQPCQPVLINSSGLYQEIESDGSTMEDYSQEDWGNHSQDNQGFPGEDLGVEKSNISYLTPAPFRNACEPHTQGESQCGVFSEAVEDIGKRSEEPSEVQPVANGYGAHTAKYCVGCVRYRVAAIYYLASVIYYSKVCLNRPNTLEDLRNNIEAEIGRIPVDMLVRVHENFRKRMQQCVDSEGRHLPDTLFKTISHCLGGVS
ncbi:unnamed protein product [Ranitomeya imitator]|uniref:Uncharacterized protein n=1 Tax=Ranitomeya imitator TaxID=111125 RepID=A0ABN9MK44_9NEOB|nr:unnamed protein product [Ranitomeya imitator]